VVFETDPDRARSIARRHIGRYLDAPNYTNNLLREGFTRDNFRDGGSDRLIDAIAGWGDDAAVLRRIDQHLAAGADHVCVQVLTADKDAPPFAEWRALAGLVQSAAPVGDGTGHAAARTD
jgi:probable F420-dependent oxidoreductase